MNVSIADLFVAGIVPGVLLGVLLMFNNVILSKLGIEKFPPAEPPSFDRLKRAFFSGLPALLTPIVILRSMTTGLVTPTEASQSRVTASGATMPVCAPISAAMLHRVMRSCMDSAVTASPAYCTAWYCAPSMPMRPHR